MNKYLPLIFLGVFLNAGAQIALKQGMRTIGVFGFCLENVAPISIKMASSPFVLTGLFCYVVSVAVWMMVLSRVDVSYAYPLLSVGYIVAAVAGRIFFAEALDLARCVGILLICAGVYMIMRSAV